MVDHCARASFCVDHERLREICEFIAEQKAGREVGSPAAEEQARSEVLGRFRTCVAVGSTVSCCSVDLPALPRDRALSLQNQLPTAIESLSTKSAALKTTIHNGVQQVERRLEDGAKRSEQERANKQPEKLAEYGGTLTSDSDAQASTAAIPVKSDLRYEPGVGELETPKDYSSV